MINENSNKHKAKIKNKRLLKGIVAGVVLSTIVLASSVAIAVNLDKDEPKNIKDDYEYSEVKTNKKKDETTKVETAKNDDLNFYCDNYGDKYYLFLDEEDMLVLIEQAMKEVDEEYSNNGNKGCFSVNDKEYSQFTKYDILGLFCTESTCRLLEIKDKNKSIFDINNYSRFQGKDKAGKIYNGPGMMDETTVNYVINTDRLQVNEFKNYNCFKIDNTQVEISFENLNPYDYVIKSGAKTQNEIEQALKENIILNVKTIYCYLNRIVKDNVREGKHDTELNKLLEYNQFKNLTQEETQIAFALIAYNNGPTKTTNAMENGTLFDKYTTGENAGKYKINVEYASKVMNYAKEFTAKYGNNNTINQ